MSFIMTIQDGNIRTTNLYVVEGAFNYLIFEVNSSAIVMYICPADPNHNYVCTVIGCSALG